MAKGLWVVLNVSSVEKSVEFYKGLGFRAVPETMGGVQFASVDIDRDWGFVLFPKDARPPSPQPADTSQWLSGELGKGVLITVGVANATRAYEKAKALRAPIDQPLDENPWGGSGFAVVDPDGYVVSLTDRFPPPAAGSRTPRKPARKKAKAAAKKPAQRAAPAKAKKSARRARR